MPANKAQLVAKAEATLEALKSMTAKQREQTPTHKFAEDFNSFRKHVLEAFPDLEDVAPEEIEIFESVFDRLMPLTRYVEIQAYYQQFVGLLKTV